MKKRYIIIGTTIISFIIVMILVITNTIKPFDDAIYSFIIGFRSNGMDKFMKFITKFGNTKPVFAMLAITFLLVNMKNKILLGSNAVATLGVNQVLKRIIRRARPDHLRLIKETGFSFPSGHSMISICLYGFLIYLCYTKIKDKRIKIPCIVLLSILILLVGISRIYVGVHYPSDVLGGYLLTISMLISIITFLNNYLRGKFNDKDGTK